MKLTNNYIKTTSNGVDINEIKKLIEEDGTKIIIVENGEPIMVVVSFLDYKKGKDIKPLPAIPTDHTDDIQELPPEFSDEGLKIEDLPF